MTPEALDFKAECDAISSLLEGRPGSIFDQPTLFKNWTVGDIIAHLHLWNLAAELSLRDPQAFTAFAGAVLTEMNAGLGHIAYQKKHFAGLSPADIFQAWKDSYPGIADAFQAADPDARVAWVGPGMNVRASIIARQMEHWAHAQAIFDRLGVEREDGPRLKNIAELGVRTYSWSFRVRGVEPPRPKPHVRLLAPNGDIWSWNDEQSDNRIDGSATGFCQTVTQCRHVADTDVVMTGDTARDWMHNAQCFAGAAETPPAPGTRRMHR